MNLISLGTEKPNRKTKTEPITKWVPKILKYKSYTYKY